MQLDQNSLFGLESDEVTVAPDEPLPVENSEDPVVVSDDSPGPDEEPQQLGESVQSDESPQTNEEVAPAPVATTPKPAPSVGSAWDRLALSYQNTFRPSTEVVGYGPGIGTEADYRLLGPLAGKRVLDLGCGGGQSAIACARQGAISIGVDISVEQLAYARRLVEQEEVKVELKHGDLAELAFQRADGVDIVFSAHALQYVPDLNRVFRQVHRVLKPQGIFVFSLPHPASSVTGRSSAITQESGQLTVDITNNQLKRSYFDTSPIEDSTGDTGLVEYHRTTSDIFMGLIRSGYRVDVVLEPELNTGSTLPQALIIRARKEA